MTFSKIILALSLVGFIGTGCTNNNYSSQSDKTTQENDTSKEETNNGSSTDEENKQPEQEGETSFTYGASSNSFLLGGLRQVFNYDLENERLELLLPLPAGIDMIGVEGSLPNNPEVSFGVDIDRSAIVVSFPLKNYLEITQNPSGMPNGRPLPGINGGEPPSFGFPLPLNDLNAYGYAAVDSISLYIELNLKNSFSFQVPITSDKDGSRVGKIYLLPAVNGYKAGVFITLSLPDELSVIIANAQ